MPILCSQQCFPSQAESLSEPLRLSEAVDCHGNASFRSLQLLRGQDRANALHPDVLSYFQGAWLIMIASTITIIIRKCSHYYYCCS